MTSDAPGLSCAYVWISIFKSHITHRPISDHPVNRVQDLDSRYGEKRFSIQGDPLQETVVQTESYEEEPLDLLK